MAAEKAVREAKEELIRVYEAIKDNDDKIGSFIQRDGKRLQSIPSGNRPELPNQTSEYKHLFKELVKRNSVAQRFLSRIEASKCKGS